MGLGANKSSPRRTEGEENRVGIVSIVEGRGLPGISKPAQWILRISTIREDYAVLHHLHECREPANDGARGRLAPLLNSQFESTERATPPRPPRDRRRLFHISGSFFITGPERSHTRTVIGDFTAACRVPIEPPHGWPPASSPACCPRALPRRPASGCDDISPTPPRTRLAREQTPCRSRAQGNLDQRRPSGPRRERANAETASGQRQR